MDGAIANGTIKKVMDLIDMCVQLATSEKIQKRSFSCKLVPYEEVQLK
jgi:hypothetical protein